jgi:hypothetical protein
LGNTEIQQQDPLLHLKKLTDEVVVMFEKADSRYEHLYGGRVEVSYREDRFLFCL